MKFKNSIFSKKRLILSLFSFLLGSFILMHSIAAARTFGVEEATESVESTEEVLSEATEEADLEVPTAGLAVEEVDYYLPYPGILPDHPLYWLKMARDRVLLWLTREPSARLERLLLYADKRVGAAEALIEGGKANLGITTASKAEKYLEQAIDQLTEVKDEAKVYQLRERLAKATLKHKEVLEGVLQKVPDQAKPAIEKAIEYSQRGYNRVMEVRERKMEKEAEKIEQKLEKTLEKAEEKGKEGEEVGKETE